MKIEKMTDWHVKGNKKATVLVLDIDEGVVEFTEDRAIFRISDYLFLQCFEECKREN